jgi:prevent-host-death family protein
MPGFLILRGVMAGIAAGLRQDYLVSLPAEFFVPVISRYCPFDTRCDVNLTVEKRSYYSGHIDRGIVMQKMAAAQFKAQCLAVMDQVSQSGRPVVITKHGKPVVKLVPANEGEDEIFGALAGIARIKGDIENTVPASDWDAE